MSITRVNQTPKTLAVGGSTTKTVTIPAVGAGNTLFLLIGGSAAALTVSAVTGGGVTWSKIVSSNTSLQGEIWAGANSTGVGTTISITVSNTYAAYDVTVVEYSGMPTTVTADGTPASNNGSSGGTGSSPTASITPTAGSVALVLAVVSCATATTAGPTGGFTALSTTGTTGKRGFAELITASASGSYSTAYTQTTFSNFESEIAGFAGSAGGGTPVGADALHHYLRNIAHPVAF